MANQIFYPAFGYWNEPIEGNFELLINPLLDDLSRKITVEQLSNFLENIYSDSLPFISSVTSDGVTIGGTGTPDDPLTIIASGFTDTNFANTNLEFTENRTHNLDAFSITFENANLFNIKAIDSLSLLNRTNLKFWDNDNTNHIIIRPPLNVISNYILTLPINAGTPGDFLSSDGSGNLSWVTPTSGSSGVQSVSGNIVDDSNPSDVIVNQIQTDWNATSGLGVLLNKPSIPDSTNDLSNDSLISGTTLTNVLNNINTALVTFNVSINYLSVLPFTLVLPYNFSINSITNPDALTVTITRNGSPYTLGTTINTFDDIVVTVSGIGFVNLNCVKL